MTRPKSAEDVAVEDAMVLAGMLRDYDRDVIAEFIDPMDRDRLVAMAVAAAAMVDIDRTPGQLLRWIDPDILRAEQRERRRQLLMAKSQARTLSPHGTHARFNHHRVHGEVPCDVCLVGEREYQRLKKRDVRARQRLEDIA